MAVLKFVLVAAFCASVTATVVDIHPCDDYTADVCTVSETRIEPCANEKRCLIKKYHNVSMAFDFTPIEGLTGIDVTKIFRAQTKFTSMTLHLLICDDAVRCQFESDIAAPACSDEKGYSIRGNFCTGKRNFSATKAKTMVYGLISNTYARFAGFGTDDACTYTNCPIEAGKLQTLNYNMYLDKYIPKGTYDLKWKLWNEENEQQGCCFKMGIKIRK